MKSFSVAAVAACALGASATPLAESARPLTISVFSDKACKDLTRPGFLAAAPNGSTCFPNVSAASFNVLFPDQDCYVTIFSGNNCDGVSVNYHGDVEGCFDYPYNSIQLDCAV